MQFNKCSQSEAYVLRRGLCEDCTDLNQKMIEVPRSFVLKYFIYQSCDYCDYGNLARSQSM